MTLHLVTNPGEIAFCLSLRGSVDKGKEEGGFQDLFTTSLYLQADNGLSLST